MANYFVSPAQKTDLHLDSREFAGALARDWHGATVKFDDDAEHTYGLRWIVPMQHRRLDGALNRAGQTVVLDGDLLDAAEFARWVRRRVPEKYDLVFYDEGYSADVPLTEGTSAEELARPFLAST